MGRIMAVDLCAVDLITGRGHASTHSGWASIPVRASQIETLTTTGAVPTIGTVGTTEAREDGAALPVGIRVVGTAEAPVVGSTAAVDANGRRRGRGPDEGREQRS